MSIDMYVSSSQQQAASVARLARQQKQGYEQLQQAINDFVLNSHLLQGTTYVSAKQFFSAVLLPLAKGGILLSEAVTEACQKFPDDYAAKVGAGDLKESELQEKIRQVQQQMTELANLQDRLHILLFRKQQDGTLDGGIANRIYGNQNLMTSYAEAKYKLEEQLRKLLEFSASSPTIFSEIDALKDAVAQGATQASTS